MGSFVFLAWSQESKDVPGADQAHGQVTFGCSEARILASGHYVNLMGDRIVDFLNVFGLSAGIFAGMCVGVEQAFIRKSNHVLLARCCWMQKVDARRNFVLVVQAFLLLSFVMSNTTCVPHLISHWSWI